MKAKTLTLLLAICLIFSNSYSQVTRSCGTMNNLERLKSLDPTLEKRMKSLEEFTRQWISDNANQKSSSVIYTIPVVVHVVYNTTSQNISDAQIQSQITVLNEDFRRTNADASNTPSTFTGVAADCEINFCLATVDPNGAATTGITRTSTSTTSFTDNDNVKYNSTGGKNAWPADKYLNIWSCNLGGGLLGYAQFPGGAAATDGVVIAYKYFGRNGSALAPFNKGRTASHEVGHWLNLYHIWGDAYCGNDNVSDTPTQQQDNAGCPTHPKSNACGTTAEMFMNYMDYTDDACMNMFSTGQKSRMRVLFGTGGARASLLTSSGCGGTATPAYCSSSSSNTTYEWIGNVKLGSINNTTGASSGYADYTSLSTSIAQGSSNTVTLTLVFASTAYTEYFNVWIDYNQDKDFVDAGELVFSSAGTTTAISGTFTVPSTATTGTTRMRVTMKDGAITGPCEMYTYGEVEDYSVSITTATSTCGTPSGLSVSSVTSSSATLNWTAVSGAGSYNVKYKPTSSTTWTNTTSTTNSKGISGLTASTTYEFQVQTVCSGSSSSYSSSSTFATSAATSTTSNTLTVGTGTSTTSVAPYGTYYMDERTQFIITKSELTSAGYNATNNKIRSLAFYVTTASAQAMNGFTIKISHTSASSFSSTSFLSTSGATTVYSGSYTAGANKWNTHTFSTAFVYNGSSNLLIDICWNNSTYSSNSSVQYTAQSSYKALYYRADLSGGGVCGNSTGSRTYNRPNMRMVFSSSATGKDAQPIEIIEAPQSFELNLYPNPASDILNIDFTVPEDNADVIIRIFNMLGETVFSNEQSNIVAGDYTYTLDINADTKLPYLSNGMYVCSIYVNGSIANKRFMYVR